MVKVNEKDARLICECLNIAKQYLEESTPANEPTIIFLIIQVYFLNKQINQSKEFKAINKELDDLYKNFEEMQ